MKNGKVNSDKGRSRVRSVFTIKGFLPLLFLCVFFSGLHSPSVSFGFTEDECSEDCADDNSPEDARNRKCEDDNSVADDRSKEDRGGQGCSEGGKDRGGVIIEKSVPKVKLRNYQIKN